MRDADPKYNCAAWAAHDVMQYWWATDQGGYFWPVKERAETVANFSAAYSTLGFRPCADAVHEDGYEKLAIYVGDDGKPKHVAIQLPNGLWTSQLSGIEDIQHSSPREPEGN